MHAIVDGEEIEMDSISMMNQIIQLVYGALHDCSVQGKSPFYVKVSDPKLKIKEYGEQWYEMIEQLKSVKEMESQGESVSSKLDQIISILQSRPTMVVNGNSQVTLQKAVTKAQSTEQVLPQLYDAPDVLDPNYKTQEYADLPYETDDGGFIAIKPIQRNIQEPPAFTRK